MSEDATESKGFFSGIRGILTGLAALITAVGGLLGTLHQTGVIGGDRNRGSDTDTVIVERDPNGDSSDQTRKQSNQNSGSTEEENSPGDGSATNRFTISQTEGSASSWFGQSEAYGNVGQGQSFQVDRTARLRAFEVYMEPDQADPNTDQIICDLRTDDMTVVASTSIPGFTQGGWKRFQFDKVLDPGTYIMTCYLKNSYTLEDHHYTIAGNTNNNSYLDGTRYGARGDDMTSASAWSSREWDLQFRLHFTAQ